MTDRRDANDMVRTQIASRGIRDAAVLAAMRTVPREAFVPPELAEFAYEDTPAADRGEGRRSRSPTSSRSMAAALRLGPRERVLEIGTGSGYAAAVLGRIAREVYTIERHGRAGRRGRRAARATLGFANVHVLHGDGTLGWPEHAPYDAIVVAAGGPKVPRRSARPARRRRAAGHPGRRGDARCRSSCASRAHADDRYDAGGPGRRPLRAADRRAGLGRGRVDRRARRHRRPSRSDDRRALIREVAEPIRPASTDVDLDALLERIGDARVVLHRRGDARHLRVLSRCARDITQELIRDGAASRIVAVEADWPDAARVDHYVRGLATAAGAGWQAFARFPTWMWRNHESLEFVDWLRESQRRSAPERRVGFYGLDLYSLYTSIAARARLPRRVDPGAARVARERYGCLTPWQGDPAAYGRAALTGATALRGRGGRDAARDARRAARLRAQRDGERFFDAVAERAARRQRRALLPRHVLRRAASRGTCATRTCSRRSRRCSRFHGPEAKARRVGAQLPRRRRRRDRDGRARRAQRRPALPRSAFGDARLPRSASAPITARSPRRTDWDGPMEVMRVRPAHPESYERLCH